MRIATWNIAGGRTINSNKKFDYDEGGNQSYFIEQLGSQNPDIVCLQESHGNDTYSLAAEIGQAIDLPYVFNVQTCPSHIDPKYKLCNAILSRQPFQSHESFMLPHPSFQLYLNGKPVKAFDRYLIVAHFSGFSVATVHLEPLSILGYDYSHGEGAEFAKEIDTLIAQSLRPPLLFTADLYSEKVVNTFPQLVNSAHLQEALPDGLPTTPLGQQPDHILYSPHWRLESAQVIQTKTDHFLCIADLSALATTSFQPSPSLLIT